ncbi:MAG TPA: FtsW/RodA/SpoVE family cell cycle protein, partial [Verrucomicrobiota bacterium]|nr:FtsW/RodA/SpoVE family cell cycle protein [Verrucomicrobiota bacterium]HQI32816.1 FtsW/RodA/SpoVE family cell cycle protein [Verrucomicrobiota bacterium]HQK00568.1 FtsW/RodA/SpoVE family cell cycle protein [Verrucomicrobiota bacterium]
EVRQVVSGHPVAQVHRQQQGGVTVDVHEAWAHSYLLDSKPRPLVQTPGKIVGEKSDRLLASYAACHLERMGDFQAGFVTPLLGSGAASLLIFVEQDWGTALLLIGASVIVLTVAGTRPVYLGGAGLGGLGLLTTLARHDPHRWARLICFLDPERYQDGIGAQQWHGLLSLGTGGLFGGFFGSGRHKFGFVPEQHTDFIFSLIGEELGLSGTLLVLGLFFLVFKSGLWIAWGAGDPFGRLLAAGLTSLITCQALVNMGVVTCLLPNKGIPLPFISFGTSDLLCMCVATGLLVSIARRSPGLPAGQAPPLSPEDDAARERRAALHALPLGDEKRPWWKRISLRLGRVGARNAFRAARSYQRPPRAIAVRPTEGTRHCERVGSWKTLKVNDLMRIGPVKKETFNAQLPTLDGQRSGSLKAGR